MPVHNKHQFPQHIWIHTDKSIGVAKESRTHTLSKTGCLNIERHHWIIPCDRQWIQLNVFFFLSLSSYQSRCHTYAHKYMHTLSHLKWCPRESMSYLDTNRSSCPWGMLECNPKLTRVHGTHTHTFTLSANHTQALWRYSPADRGDLEIMSYLFGHGVNQAYIKVLFCSDACGGEKITLL